DLGSLDQSAIDGVREEAWPEVQNADELHDALIQLGFLSQDEGFRKAGRASSSTQQLPDSGAVSEISWEPWLEELIAEHRATRLRVNLDGPRLWVAAERLQELKALFPSATVEDVSLGPSQKEESVKNTGRAEVALFPGTMGSSQGGEGHAEIGLRT